MPSETCRDDCTTPRCGDGIVDSYLGEECDGGADCNQACKTCKCEASAEYNITDGTVTIDFDLCGSTGPTRYDWVAIYPCDSQNMTADQAWWESEVCRQHQEACGGNFSFGYKENQMYVNGDPVWWSYTCSSPLDGGCQTNSSYIWPERGSVTIDPTVAGADWAFDGGRVLAPGCYKVLLNREIDIISPPPYPTICGGWDVAPSFIVP